ncbi:MAG TPA: DUF1579 family protein [Polyangiaceae bacterium]|nr:DUF1579 family protein [Polyangiaceae bacterium]
MDMPKPTPSHEKLHVFAGEWQGEETMQPSPMGPGGRATGKMTARVDIDGFFVISDYVQQKDSTSTYRGHGVYGFDVDAAEYTWYWVDSMGFPSVPSRGKWEGETLVFESSFPHGKGRYTYRWEGRDKHHFSIENSFDGGASWSKFMDATYTRRG